MCRLFLANGEMFDERFDEGELTRWFDKLVVTSGGNGNGAAALLPDGRIKIRKGMSRSTHDLSRWLFRQRREDGAQWLLFHTRRATVGELTSRLCHPFRKGPYVLAHNGHVRQFADLARLQGTGGSDSLLIAEEVACKQLEPDVLLNERYSWGVYLGFWNGFPFVAKGQEYTTLTYLSQGNGHMFVSTVPTRHAPFERVTPLRTFYWCGAATTSTPRNQYRQKAVK